jgi:uncharacterized protein (DUF433 family)
MTLTEALWQDSERVSGAIWFRGTRVPVKTLFDHLSHDEIEEIYAGFPNVTHEMVEAVLESSYWLIEKEFLLRKSA